MSNKFDNTNSNNYMQIDDFKTRLSQQRKTYYSTQQEFTEALGFTHRSKIATWESTSTQTLPNLYDFYTICKALKCDPNYLLGYDKLECANDNIASEYTHLSINAVKKLRERSFSASLTSALITSPKSSLLMYKIFQLCDNGCRSIVPERIFSPDALIRLEQAFEVFRNNTSPLDMNPDNFFPYVKTAFPWDKDSLSFKDLLMSLIIDKKYYSMVFNHPDFSSQSDDERYNALMADITKSSYNYLISPINNKLIENEITQMLSEIVIDFINSTVLEFKDNYNK